MTRKRMILLKCLCCLCNRVLFSKSLFTYVDDIERMWEFAWGAIVYEYLMDSIPKLKKMERKMPKKGKKGKRDAMKAAYLNGCVFALLAWASKLVGFPRMFRWEEKKAPHNPESTLQLLANVKDSQIFHFVPSSNEKVVLLRPKVPNE